MPIDYNPSDAIKLFEAGDYQAELNGYEDRLSKAGKPMAVLNWQIYPNNDGPSILLRDYIVVPDSVWKLKKLAKALGVQDKFNDGTFQPEDHKGCSVIVSLKVKTDEKYGEQNVIVNYKPHDTKESPFKSAVKQLQTKEQAVIPSYAPDDSVPADEIPF